MANTTSANVYLDRCSGAFSPADGTIESTHELLGKRSRFFYLYFFPFNLPQDFNNYHPFSSNNPAFRELQHCLRFAANAAKPPGCLPLSTSAHRIRRIQRTPTRTVLRPDQTRPDRCSHFSFSPPEEFRTSVSRAVRPNSFAQFHTTHTHTKSIALTPSLTYNALKYAF